MMNSQSALVVLAVLLMSGTALGQSCTKDDCSTMCGGNMAYQSANGMVTCTCATTNRVVCSVAAPSDARTTVQTCRNRGIITENDCAAECGNMQFSSSNGAATCICTEPRTSSLPDVIACRDVPAPPASTPVNAMGGPMGSLGTRPAVAVWALVATAMFAAMLTL
jgi:hypothetical protein